MGLNSSTQYNTVNADWGVAKQNANRIYNYRIKNYNPLVHGPMHYYMLQVEAEYELECIPEYYRSGSDRGCRF